MTRLNYAERAAYCFNPTAQKLLLLMQKKQSNLAVSADYLEKAELLHWAQVLGPEICVFKTHIDIVKDFDWDLTVKLRALAEKHQFLIFEDRKFADIGHTVKLQYAQGIYRMVEWAPITNAHTIGGAGTIEGLKAAGISQGNGLLLLAEMSSKGNLIDKNYTRATVDLAVAHSDFVIGFIAQHRLSPHPAFIHFTPGVNTIAANDSLGQHYISPEEALLVHDTDVIIVGRGIYAAPNPLEAAQDYRKIAWQAYASLQKS